MQLQRSSEFEIGVVSPHDWRWPPHGMRPPCTYFVIMNPDSAFLRVHGAKLSQFVVFSIYRAHSSDTTLTLPSRHSDVVE